LDKQKNGTKKKAPKEVQENFRKKIEVFLSRFDLFGYDEKNVKIIFYSTFENLTFGFQFLRDGRYVLSAKSKAESLALSKYLKF